MIADSLEKDPLDSDKLVKDWLNKYPLDRPAPLAPKLSKTGNAAINNKAKNQTANRVPEFLRPKIRSRIQPNSASPLPSTMQFSRRSDENRARD